MTFLCTWGRVLNFILRRERPRGQSVRHVAQSGGVGSGGAVQHRP